jgi:glycogen(starch) synthase
MRKPVLYVEGSGDVVKAYESWVSGHDYLSETSVTFSSQVFQVCKERSVPLYALSSHSRIDSLKEGNFTVTNGRRLNIRIPKIGYELTVFLYTLRLLFIALRLRPETIIINAGVIDWAYLPLLRLSGAKIVPVMHNTLWPEGFRPKFGLRHRIYRFVWRRCVWQTLGVSPACARQVQSLAAVPVIVFKPSFPVASFKDAPQKDFADAPFRVMYAGRIEENKGVFDVLKMAEKLPHVEFSMCGDGSSLPEIKRQIIVRRLKNVKTYGNLARPELVEQYRAAHLVVVPTRSTFAEGFAMVAAEAILMLRPVITSQVVPASEVLAKAIVCVTTDDAEAYASAIEKLSMDETAYIALVKGAQDLRQFILDDATSFCAGLRSVVSN